MDSPIGDQDKAVSYRSAGGRHRDSRDRRKICTGSWFWREDLLRRHERYATTACWWLGMRAFKRLNV